MKEYVLQDDAPWDVPTFEQEKQTIIDEEQVNETFEPANDAFSGLRDLGDWLVQFFTDFFSGIFGTIM